MSFSTLKNVVLASLLLNVVVVTVDSKCLVREPPDTFTPPQETDAGFYISVNGNPVTTS
jgi:hypothetical protein